MSNNELALIIEYRAAFIDPLETRKYLFEAAKRLRMFDALLRKIEETQKPDTVEINNYKQLKNS